MGVFSGVGGVGRTILSFGANLVVDVKGLKNLGKLGKKIDVVNKKFIGMGVTTIFLDRLVQSLTRAWSALNSVIGVGRVAKQSEEILRLSKASGVATDRLQAFAGMASVVGAELSDVSDLFQTVAERVDDLRSGTEQGISDDFLRFGMSSATFRGANNGMDQFMVMIRELDKLEPERRMAGLEKLLGGDLARKFGQLGNTQDIVRGMQEAIDTGQILSEQQLKDGERFAQAQRRLGRLMTALSNNIGASLLPVLAKAADVLSEVTASAAKFFNSRAAQFGQNLVDAMQPFFDKIIEIKDFIDNNVKDGGEFLSRTAQGILIIVVTIGALLFSKILGAFVAISTVVFVVSQVIDDILTFLRGGDSLLGSWLGQSETLRYILATWMTAFEQVKVFLDQIFATFKELAAGPFGAMLISTLKVVATVLALGLGQALAGALKIMSTMVFYAGKLLNLFAEVLGIVGQFAGIGVSVLADAFTGRGKRSPDSLGMDVVRGVQARFAQTGGISGALSNAWNGDGPTSTQMLLGQAGLVGGNTTINQTNNIAATTSDPEGFASDAIGRSGRSLATLAGD